MFIKDIKIKNFRIFPEGEFFEVNDINIPNEVDEGSGLTVFVGENGCGKTTLLEALALPLLSYKADSVDLDDFSNPRDKIEIEVLSEVDYSFSGTMPNSTYKGKGFSFEAGIRSRDTKAYLSSVVVSDQKFIRADGESKPADGSVDLRVSVNNPFKGQRFNENDVLFLDKNRLYQSRSGTYNTTRFDRLMEDFDFQYLKKKGSGEVPNLNDDLNVKVKQSVENTFLGSAVRKFEEISGTKLTLDFMRNWKPFKGGFFAETKTNNQQIPISMLGAGYEMIFSLIYSYYLSGQSGKQLIVLIDEPELHMHPSLQKSFVDFLLEISKNAQIILTSHSPLLIKQLCYNEKVKVNILKKDNTSVELVPLGRRLLAYVSSNEINFLAFDLPTEEYHNELYEELKDQKGANKKIKIFDGDFFVTEKGEAKDSPWLGYPNEVSFHTFIRNQIHHQKDNGKVGIEELKKSIEKMRTFLEEIINPIVV